MSERVIINKEEEVEEEKEKDIKDNIETTETPVTEPPILNTSSTERTASVEEENLPDNIRHLYYRPTRSPDISSSTSDSREVYEIRDQSENTTEANAGEEKQTDVWTRIRRLFRDGSPSTAEPLPTTTTTTTELPEITTSYEEVVPQNKRRTVFFSPVIIGR